MNKIFLILISLAFCSCTDNSNLTSDPTLSEQDRVLIDFYQQKPVKFGDRSVNINDFWNYSNQELEDKHNYIQWLFPTALAGQSPAPVLSEKSVALLRSNKNIKKKRFKIF